MSEPSDPAGPLGYTLWAGTVGFTSPLAERFAAAAATGCRQATLSPPDVLRAAADGMTAADWARNKTAELTQANYMIGSVNFQAEKWEAADQAFRAALPNLTDPRFRAEALSSLGWANYKLKNVSDSIKFYIECTNIPGPLQQAASKTLNTITAEYRIK